MANFLIVPKLRAEERPKVTSLAKGLPGPHGRAVMSSRLPAQVKRRSDVYDSD